jgi:hypothetical protein
MNSKLLTAREIKEQCSIVDLLTRLGYEPVPKRGREKMYISMLRDDDKTPSLAVNDELGVWFDHGTGKGGNIIDFGLAYWKNYEFKEVIKKLQEAAPTDNGIKNTDRPKVKHQPSHIVSEVKPLGTHAAITNYLKSRGIFQEAKKCLREIYYYIEDDQGVKRHFFAAGWQNENSGWEVRNKFFKGCIGHKDITFLAGNDKKVALFEGFMDYLSWRQENPAADQSVIVLNTITMLSRAIERAKAFSAIDIYFDRDKQGLLVSREFLKNLPYATDRSNVYAGYNDYNEKIKAKLKEATDRVNPPADIFSGVRVPFER